MPDWHPVPRLPGMRLWLCEYRGPDGHLYNLDLPATDPGQLEQDHASLPGFRVLGELFEQRKAEGWPDAD